MASRRAGPAISACIAPRYSYTDSAPPGADPDGRSTLGWRFAGSAIVTLAPDSATHTVPDIESAPGTGTAPDTEPTQDTELSVNTAGQAILGIGERIPARRRLECAEHTPPERQSPLFSCRLWYQ
jgi:hypothetical protein